MSIRLGIILLVLLGGLSVEAKSNWQEEVTQIEAQIEELKNRQEKYRSSATRNSNNAMRWQFQSENYSDARKAWGKVAQDKQKIEEIQDQINDLEAHKLQILQEHGNQK